MDKDIYRSLVVATCYPVLPMGIKNLLMILVVLLTQSTTFGQSESASVLTHGDYVADPAKYLSTINPNQITSGILIDRTFFNDVILNVNGQSKVTTLSCFEWATIYNQLKYASYDTSYVSNIASVKELISLYYQQSRTYPIGIIDFNFQKIEQGAMDRGELVERDEFLEAKNTKTSSFSNHRVVAASCLSHNIYGDDVNFVVSTLLHSTNVEEEELTSIEIDFGNGEGYQRVDFNETVNVIYSPVSEYIEIKTRLTYENNSTSETETYYARSSVFRTGSSTVPLADNLSTTFTTNGRNSTPIKPKDPIYYPKPYFKSETRCPEPKPGVKDPGPCVVIETRVNSKLEVHMLYSPQNTSGKLRRPFVVTDGFDPGDKRDYYRTDIEIDKNTLPRDKDERGLYQLVNGDPSPWYSDKETTSPNVIAALRADGYDIVFINFLDGAGKIQDNAKVLRNFFNEILNSSTYRDNKTEEAILVGPSMGGIITRHMLKTMEKANEEPFVKIWISFDSPQHGANIPLALQKAIQHLEDVVPGGKKAPLQASLDKINTPAARQLLLSHYTAGGKGTTEHNQLYSELGNLGYPTYSKNYGITNGGKSKLYDQDGTQIVAFYSPVPIYFPFVGQIISFKSFENGSKNAGDQIALDNGPGGWNSALYSLNLDNANSVTIAETNIPYTRATFIPTTSAFGIKVTQGNVAKGWNTYEASNTPFDQLHGMDGANEEHVKISAATRNYLIDELRNDFDNTTRPRLRSGQVLNQRIRGKEAITTRQNMTLGGRGNSLTLENKADVVASAGSSITLLPGFTAKAGSSFVAKIASISYSTVQRTADLVTVSVDYTQPSPYTGTVYNYQEDEVTSAMAPDRLEVVAYPNPLEDWVALEVSGLQEPYADLQISNALGQVIYRNSKLVNGVNTLDLMNLRSGIYYVKITYNDTKTKSFKIIKL